MTGSVLFHVQYLLGIGHLQRSLRIAEALVAQGVPVTLVSGGEPILGLRPDPRIRFVQLEPVRARDARFQLIDTAGNPIDDALRARRRAALLAAYAEERPDAVVIEGFPFARRAFRFELDPLIDAVNESRPRPRLVCSVRDIVVRRDDPARQREIITRVRADCDAVLVHGDPEFVPFEASFPAAAEIADRLAYTGYVGSTAAAGDAAPNDAEAGVIVSGGGGPAGQALLMTALAVRRQGCLADLPWRLLTGATLPEADFAALARGAPADVQVDRFRRDFPALLRRCHVSVSQAGYNTVMDVLAARARAVLVPFAAERETEQLLRAEALAARGVAEVVRESELSPEILARAIERAAARGPVALALDTGGATRSARLIATMIGARTAEPGFVAEVRESIVRQ
ncbi:MAG TPA: glycosyltransferase [Stellaceae bacterium]